MVNVSKGSSEFQFVLILHSNKLYPFIEVKQLKVGGNSHYDML